MSAETASQLDRLFHPKAVAVVGASPDGDPNRNFGGKAFIEALVGLNFRGKIYPVHRKAESVLGLKAYKSVRDVPDDLDLVVFSVPASAVLNVMQDCVEKGVKFAHVFTAGFSETGLEELAQIENDLVALAREGGVRIVGPNCMGVYCPEGGVAWHNDFPKESGPIAFVSQSGQMAGQFIFTSRQWGVRFSKVVSFGNGSDLQCHDFLQYLAEDGASKIIGMYLEGIRDGRAFFETARSLSTKKPLVLWKGGRTEGGTRAVSSHTASIAGSEEIWKALCRQTGIIQVDQMEDLIGTVSALHKLSRPRGPNVAIAGGAGGGSVTMTDAAESEGLKVPHLSDATIRGLGEFVPVSGQSIKNPLDMNMALGDPENFKKTIELLRDDPCIDALIYWQRPHGALRRGRDRLEMIVQATIEAHTELKKPMFLVLSPSQAVEDEMVRAEVWGKYDHAGLAVFPTFKTAARAAYNLTEYQRFLDSKGSDGG
jgi:acyl-CoA synthetase (NDP forming)